MRVALGADAIGAGLKDSIARHLAGGRTPAVACLDLTPGDVAAVDGPEVAEAVASAILGGRAERGILVCGSGVGLSIAANKVAGIRAVLCADVYTATHARQSSDTQVLVLGSRVVGQDLALAIVDAWLDTDFEETPRRHRRLERLAAMEARRAGSSDPA